MGQDRHHARRQQASGGGQIQGELTEADSQQHAAEPADPTAHRRFGDDEYAGDDGDQHGDRLAERRVVRADQVRKRQCQRDGDEQRDTTPDRRQADGLGPSALQHHPMPWECADDGRRLRDAEDEPRYDRQVGVGDASSEDGRGDHDSGLGE